MKNVIIQICALWCIQTGCACGDMLKCGEYKVFMRYIASDWSASSGDTALAKWNIDQDGSKYLLNVVGTDTVLRGVEHKDKGNVQFTLKKDYKPNKNNPECENSNELKMVLKPNKEGNEFVGIAYSVLRVCLDAGFNDIEEMVQVKGQKVD